MKDSWHPWERWPYWFKSPFKLKLMGEKWKHTVSPILSVHQVISPHADQLIPCINLLLFPITNCITHVTQTHQTELKIQVLFIFSFLSTSCWIMGVLKCQCWDWLQCEMVQVVFFRSGKSQITKVSIWGKKQCDIRSNKALAFHWKGKKVKQLMRMLRN